MRFYVISFLVVLTAILGPFVIAWLRDGRQGPKPDQGAVAGQRPANDAGQPPADVDDVEPPQSTNPLIRAMRQMINDSPAFEETSDELHQQLSEADQMLTKIKQENREALASLRRRATRTRTQRPSSSATAPHIVLIDVGTLTADELSCYNSDAEKTPLFDLLASQGVRFQSFYRTSTNADRERIALLSGAEPLKGKPFDAEADNLIRSLTAAGYEVAIIGDCALPGGDPHLLGFDSWFGAPTRETARQRTLGSVWSDGAELKLMQDGGKAFDTQTVYLAEAFAFAERQIRSQPFFLWLSLPLPDADSADANSPDDRRSQIKRLEKELAEYIAELNRKKIANNSVVIVTSLSAPARNKAESAYGERRMRAPLIILGPGRVHRKKIDDSLVTTADLWATIAALAKAKGPNNRSISLQPTLTGRAEENDKQRSFVAWRDDERRLVRFDHWRVVRKGEGRTELFDLDQADSPPKNVAGYHPQIVARGKRYLAEAFEQTAP